MSHPLSGAGAGSLFRAALVVLALAAPSSAAADIPVAEVGSSAAIAVHRNTLAWIDDGAASVVLRHPGGRTQRFPAADTNELSLGSDRRGRLVLVYARCTTPRRCSLRRVNVRTGQNERVRSVGGSISRPVLRRGVLAWQRGDGGDVRTRRLAGGRIRRQTVGRDIDVTGLDHDGRRLVVTGETSPDSGQGQVDLRIVALGSRRARVLRSVSRGEDFHVMHSPLLGPRSVDVADAYVEETADTLVRVPLRGRRVTRSFGTNFTAIARGGGTLAYIDAPSHLGCGSFVEDDDLELGLVEGAGCRIVRAAGGAARTLPPELVAGKPVAESGGGWRVTGRLQQRALGGPTVPLAGRQVAILVGKLREIRDSYELRYPPSGPQVVTGADGRWSYSLPPDREVRYVGARTVDAPRTWVNEAVTLLAAP